MAEDTKESVYHALGTALIEIRAAQNLEGAKILADVFHNVPSQLQAGVPFPEIKKDILQRAERLNVRQFVERWF